MPGKIHRIVCDQLDRIARREIDRLMLLCPPQHGKSQITSRRFPAYLLGREPAEDWISASATASLAEGFGRDVRNCIAGPEYRNLFPDTQLAEDSSAKDRWHTKQGGGYVATGVGGQLYGKGGGAIVDDPFGSWADAQSELKRESVWEWYRGTLYNRIRPGRPIIVIQHRMHEEDLAGRLLAQQACGGDKWEVVNLPADLNDPPWPERYDRKALERIKANTDPLMWSALYMQNPQPEEGTFFKRENFFRFRLDEIPAVRKYASSDFAFTPDDGDFTEFGIHGTVSVGGETKLYLGMDGWYGQWDATNWVDEYVNMIRRNKPMAEFSEAGSSRRAAEGWITKRKHELKVFGGPIEWFPHIGDKVVKASALRSMALMGRVGIIANDYGDRLLNQLVGFPNGAHDDAVDMVALMGRAINDAHPALQTAPARPVQRDRYDRLFDREEESSWRV